jgi:hypothetical protein
MIVANQYLCEEQQLRAYFMPLILGFSKDSANTVIDVTKFYGSDVKAISGLSANMRELIKLKAWMTRVVLSRR